MRGVSMKYMFTLFALSACGVWAASAGISANEVNLVATELADTERRGVKNSSEENRRENSLAQSHTYAPERAVTTPTPIRALILPNNVCVINTDLAPDRSIEDHILACVEAQRIRNTIAR